MIKGYYAKDISLAFSNGEQVDFTLDDTSEFQTIDLEGIGNEIITNYVNITVISMNPEGYPEAYFGEFKVFGYASGMILTITERNIIVLL